MKTSKWSQFWFGILNALLVVFTGQSVEQRAEKFGKTSARQMLEAFAEGLKMADSSLTLEMLTSKLTEVAQEQQGLADEKSYLAQEKQDSADQTYAEAMHAATAARSSAYVQVEAIQAEATTAQNLAAKANRLAQAIGQ